MNERMFRAMVLESPSLNPVVNSDGQWTGTASGPVVSDHVYDGETYDARLEQPGWAAPGFAGAGWTPVNVVDPSCFNPILTPMTMPGIDIDSERSALTVSAVVLLCCIENGM